MITKNASKLLINKVFKDTETINKTLNNLEEEQFSICPFVFILGQLASTEAGIRAPGFVPSNYSQLQLVFNGRNSLIAEWLGSYDLKQVINTDTLFTKDPDTNELISNNYWEKTFKTGEVFKGVLSNSSIDVQFTPSNVNADAVSLSLGETINLTIMPPKDDGTGWKQNEKFIDNLTNYAYNGFVIPEIFSSEYDYESPNLPDGKKPSKNVYKDANKKYFYINGATAIYDKNTKKIAYVEVSFATINDKIANSNLAINQYIQNGAPGAPYAFPRLNSTTKEIEVDPTYLVPSPVTHFQVGFFGNTTFTDIMFVGRPIRTLKDAQGNINGYKILPPRLICPRKYQAGELNQLLNATPPQSNYFSLIDSEPSINEYFDTWKQSILVLYNIPAGKLSGYEGVLNTNNDATLATNGTPTGTEKYIPYWDDAFLSQTTDYNDKDYNVLGSDLFICVAPDQHDRTKWTGLTKFNPKNLINKKLANWNLINYGIFKSFYMIPESIRQTTPIALSSIPVVGAFLNKFTLGLDPGWKSITNLNQPDAFPVPALCPCETYKIATSIMKGGQSGTTGLFPYDFLKTDTIDSPLNLYGTNNVYCSMTGNLSNRISCGTYAVNTTNDGSTPSAPISIDTRELEAYPLDENGVQDKTKVCVLDANTDVLKPNTLKWEEYKVGYIIDKVIIQAQQKGKMEIVLFSQTDNIDGDIDSNKAIWYGYYQTLSTNTKNIRTWSNEIIMSNPLWKENIPPFPYPYETKPVIPTNTNNFSSNVFFNSSNNIKLQASRTNNEFGPETNNYKMVGVEWNNPAQTLTSINVISVLADYTVSSIDVDIDIKYTQANASIDYDARTQDGTDKGGVDADKGTITINIKKTINTPTDDVNFNATFPISNNTKGTVEMVDNFIDVTTLSPPPPTLNFDGGNVAISATRASDNKLQLVFNTPFTSLIMQADQKYRPNSAGKRITTTTVDTNMNVQREIIINSFVINYKIK